MNTYTKNLDEHNLIRGMVNKEQLDLLIGFTSIRSDSVIKMLHRHFVDGWSEDQLVQVFGCSQSNLNRDINKIKQVARDIFCYLRISNVRYEFNAGN